jgi:hypothetical protein
MTLIEKVACEKEPGPIWGGWWLWEPPNGAEKEHAINLEDGHDRE